MFETTSPLGKNVEAELRTNLDRPGLKISWAELRASDMQARARSLQNMVQSGMDIAKVVALSGLVLPEED